MSGEALTSCAKVGDLDGFIRELKKGADINYYYCQDIGERVEYFYTSLQYACQYGHLNIVQYCTNNGAWLSYNTSVNAMLQMYVIPHGGSEVRLASRFGHYEIVKYLVENVGGVDINKTEDTFNDSGYNNASALICAIEGNHLKVVEYLVEKKADVNKAKLWSLGGMTAAHYAIRDNRLEMLKCLVEKGKADLTISSNTWKMEGETPLHIAAKNFPLLLPIFRYLVTTGIDVNIQSTGSGKTALHYAIECFESEEDLVGIIYLVQTAEVNVNIMNKYHQTALHLASKLGHLSIVKILAENRADVELRGISYLCCKGSTALDLAKQFKKDDVVQYLSNYNRNQTNRKYNDI